MHAHTRAWKRARRKCVHVRMIASNQFTLHLLFCVGPLPKTLAKASCRPYWKLQTQSLLWLHCLKMDQFFVSVAQTSTRSHDIATVLASCRKHLWQRCPISQLGNICMRNLSLPRWRVANNGISRALLLWMAFDVYLSRSCQHAWFVCQGLKL